MFKKILILLLSTVLLFSCGEEESKTKSLTQYTSTGFTINIPTTWEIIKDKEKILPKPTSGEVTLSVSSKEEKNGISNNLLIVENKLNGNTTSKDFSIFNNNGLEKRYLNYKVKSKSEIIFSDNDNSTLYVFTAKYNRDTPSLKFIQTAKVCNQRGFFLTIALHPDIINTSKYEDILNSFSCNN